MHEAHTAVLWPMFGNKTKSAPIVWERFGDVRRYIEPFCGGCGVLRGRPIYHTATDELVNDKDGLLVNALRTIQSRPEALARRLCEVPSHSDLVARRRYVLEQRDAIRDLLEHDPAYADERLAAWWIQVMCMSIGTPRPDRGLPDWSNGSGCGLVAAWHRHGQAEVERRLRAWARRLDRVMILNSDWTRSVAPSLVENTCPRGEGAGIFLDPPYEVGHFRYTTTSSGEGRTVAAEVREWLLTDPYPEARICIAGYDSEHDALTARGWVKVPGVAGSSGRALVRKQEMLWFSPKCQPTSETIF